MTDRSVLVHVPATVGNFAGAIDRAALALDHTLNVKVAARPDNHLAIRYFGENGERVPRGRSNLVVQGMEAALHARQREFKGADVEIYNSVPVGVGLGSSAAAVLAGLIAADRLFGLELGEETLLDLGAVYEPRADNLRGAWLGGLVVSTGITPESTQRTEVPPQFVLHVVVPESLPAAAVPVPPVPPVPLEEVDGAYYLGRALEVAGFLAYAGAASGPQLVLANAAIPAGARLLPGLHEALAARQPDALAVFLCGAGPAVGILATGDAEATVAAVQDCFKRCGVQSGLLEFRPGNKGARELNPARAAADWPADSTSPTHKPSLIPV
jgi:homoserine kinase